MNLVQLVRKARQGVDAILPGGSASAQWSDEEMVDIVNEAYEYTLREFRLVHKKWGLTTLNTDSAAFTRDEITYTPSTDLVFDSTATTVTLPPDFAELVRISCTSDRSIRFMPAQSESEHWIDLESDGYDDLGNAVQSSSRGLVYYYDFIGDRTLFFTPPTTGSYDLEIDYVPMRRPMYYSKAGTVSITNASTTLTGTNTTWSTDGVTTEAADAEIIVGTNNLQSNAVRVDKDYPKVTTISSNTAAVLKTAYAGSTVSDNPCIIAMCPAIPREYHRWITRMASSLMLSKINPDLAEKYLQRFMGQFREQINPVIRRRTSQGPVIVEDSTEFGMSD